MSVTATMTGKTLCIRHIRKPCADILNDVKGLSSNLAAVSHQQPIRTLKTVTFSGRTISVCPSANGSTVGSLARQVLFPTCSQ